MQVRPVEGGMVISGRVPWGSGIVHADWVGIGGAAPGGDRYQFLVPAADTRILDTWHMAAMSGTGSHDFELHDVFVPAHRILPAAEFRTGDTPGARLHGNPQYLMPVLPFIYCETMGIFSGGIRGAADAFTDIVRSRVRTHSGAALADDRYGHIKLGEVAAAVDVVERLVVDLTQEAIDLAGRGAFTMADRVRLKARAGFIVDLCRRTANDLIHHSGASNFAVSAPAQRYFRDFNLLATHAFYEWDVCREQLGRARLGLAPNHPLVSSGARPRRGLQRAAHHRAPPASPCLRHEAARTVPVGAVQVRAADRRAQGRRVSRCCRCVPGRSPGAAATA